MNTKIKRILTVLSGIISLILGGYTVYLFIAHRTMIIIMGLQTYRMVKSICLICSIVTFILTCILLVTSKLKKKKIVDYAVDKKLVAEIETITENLLSIKCSVNVSYPDRIHIIYTNLMTVLEYYKSLEEVIKNSGQFDLSTSDEILAQVLTTMKKSVEHFIRVARILGPADRDEIEKELEKCYTETHSLKTKSLDFTTSILNYIHNNDGENVSDALDSISAYKEVILNELSIVEKYL